MISYRYPLINLFAPLRLRFIRGKVADSTLFKWRYKKADINKGEKRCLSCWENPAVSRVSIKILIKRNYCGNFLCEQIQDKDIQGISFVEW